MDLENPNAGEHLSFHNNHHQPDGTFPNHPPVIWSKFA